jgi:predicted metalloprotease
MARPPCLRAGFLILLLCVAVLPAGCGSSDDTTTAPKIESAALKRLRPVAAATGDAPASAGSRNGYLRAVFDDAQSMWQREFQAGGVTYRPARLTIFTGRVDSGCGPQSGSVGPFYCPRSFGVYLDPRFFAALSRHVGVQLGDFAQAYVIAHEVAHHVQTLLGLTRQKAEADRQDPEGANARSVLFELQADCFAGVWAHSAFRQGAVSQANIRDALNAAAVVGDDFQSKLSGNERPPEDWTHGSSAQRQHWLHRGRPGRVRHLRFLSGACR